jgi:DNA-binding NtrC family response regulator
MWKEYNMDTKAKRKVLFLEDEPVISKVVTRILMADGFEVDVANNGQIAKDKINSGAVYDLFIFDIKTPIINGIQLYEYLEKEHPELTDKVIIATGDSLNEATKGFLERVNRPFLAKPYTLAQIKTTVHQVLGE